MTTGEVIALIKAFGGGGGGSSGGGVLVVHATGEDDARTLDKTWQQIHDALLSGGAVIALSDQNVEIIRSVAYSNIGSSYYVETGSGEGFVTAEADGYPVVEGDD